jgi:hypothetical protein
MKKGLTPNGLLLYPPPPPPGANPSRPTETTDPIPPGTLRSLLFFRRFRLNHLPKAAVVRTRNLQLVRSVSDPAPRLDARKSRTNTIISKSNLSDSAVDRRSGQPKAALARVKVTDWAAAVPPSSPKRDSTITTTTTKTTKTSDQRECFSPSQRAAVN